MRLVDFACVIGIVLAVIVAMSGGFRLRVAGVRVALTSPDRLLLWAIGLTIVRHLIYRRAPIYRDVPSRIAAWSRTSAVRTAAAVLLGTRPAILFVGYLAIFMIGYREVGVPWRFDENEFINLQARWDTGWYLGIATDGYRYNPEAQGQQNIVFFPAYPMAIRVVGRLLGGGTAAFVWSGAFLSLFAFLGGLIYLYRLARELLDSEADARDAAWLLATYPFALFYSAAYSESLFLLGTAGAFYHFRRREFVRAGAWGLLVGLTRPNGCFLSVALGLLALTPWLPRWLAGGPVDSPDKEPDRERRSVATAIKGLAAAALPAIGLAWYCAFIWSLTGDPLRWAEGQAAWGRHYVGLGTLAYQRYDWVTHGGVYAYIAGNSGDLLNVLGALFIIVAALPVARRLGLPYAVFILINILPQITSGFLSAGRFSSVLFPAFIWLATAIPPRHRPGWFASFMAVQALNASLFYTWRMLY